MPKRLTSSLLGFLLLMVFSGQKLLAHSAEVFAKANISKSYLSSSGSDWVFTVGGSTGLAFRLVDQIRIEGRFMLRYSETNQMRDTSGSPYLRDIKTQTNIYSLGLDIDILSDKHTIQPFIYLGGGYIESMSVYTSVYDGSTGTSKRYGPSVNGGAGFRIRVGKSMAVEIEGFAYTQDIDKKNPLIDWSGSFGIRIYM